MDGLTDQTIAIIGGTGSLGSGLARRWAAADLKVVLGSRSAEKATDTAQQMSGGKDGARLTGATNVDAARQGDIVVLTVPFASHFSSIEEIAPHLAGKILVVATVPLLPPAVARVQMPAYGSVAAETQRQLGDGVRVVAAFQNIAAERLHDLKDEIDCDVLVCGNDKAARSTVVALAEAARLTAWHAGSISNAIAPEAFTSLLIFMNKHHGFHGAGLRISGGRG